MSEQSYPWIVQIYKGEGRYAIEPMLYNKQKSLIYCDEYRIVDETADTNIIASVVDEMKKFIQNSPCPNIRVKDAVQPEHISKYHNCWSKFLKNNLLTSVMYYEDSILIFSLERRSRRGGGSGYCGGIESIELPLTATQEEIGQAILQAFDAAEKFYSVGKYKPKRERKTTKMEE